MMPDSDNIQTSSEAGGAPSDVVAYSNTARQVAAPESLEEFEFNWPELFAGDCKLGATSLAVRSDGTAHWRANDVLSTSGDDSWGATFEFFDVHGISLWTFGRIWSPSLSPPFAVIVWVNDDQLFFPAYLFPHIAQAALYSHC